MKVTEHETPALLLDIDAVDRNVKRMADYFRGKRVSLRPHVKVHKSPFLAHKQIEAGANGITCAKISEAEVMASSGIEDILIANEIVGEDKLRRLARLGRYCRIGVLVDDEENARQISSFASKENSTIRVLLELNLSSAAEGILDRCGIPPGPNVVKLAHRIAKLENIEFSGLVGYEGSLRTFPNPESRRIAVRKALALLVETKDQIKDSGLEVSMISCGGTMSYNIAGEFPGITEVQAGSYIFMDTTYRRFGIDFEIALTVLTRVISRPRPDKVIVDAGLKAISTDHGLPMVKEIPNLEVMALNAEHGHIAIKENEKSSDFRIERDDKLELLPAHVDTTVCLYDDYVVTRRGEVQMTLKIPCRGKLQ